VSRTQKDSKQIKNTVLEVVRKDDGSFDLFLNRKLDRDNIPETWLSAESCARFGFCGEEYDSILREVSFKTARQRWFSDISQIIACPL